MNARRRTSNRAVQYIIAILIIIVAFLLLGGGPWFRGMMHGSVSVGFGRINWVHVLISITVGFLLGYLAGRRKW